MSISRAISLFLAISTGLLWSQDTPTTATVSGVVTNQSEGSPIKGALVTLQPIGPGLTRHSDGTDAAGHFTISNIQAGK